MSPLVAAWAAIAVVLAVVAPALAVEGPTRLYDPSVTPRVGTPTTTIRFEVVYRNREGSAPDHVSVIVDGVAHQMTGGGGSDWKAGVAHAWSATLAVGTHTITFEASDTRRFSDTIGGGTVTISAPSPEPTPRPTPTPTPRPTPKPTPLPAPLPSSSPTPAPATQPDPGPGDSGGGTGGGTTGLDGVDGDGWTGESGGMGDGGLLGGGATPSTGSTTDPGTPTATDPSADGSDPSTVSQGGQPTDGSAGSDWTAGSPDRHPAGGGATAPTWPGPTGPASGPVSDSAAPGTPDGVGRSTDGPGSSAFSAALEALGVDRPPQITMIPMLVGTSGAVAMTFAFAIFGKKRRDGEPPAPDEVLQANAARGVGHAPGGELAAVAAGPAGLPVDLEAAMPRWRRPSLLEARKADPARSVAVPQRLSFDNGVVGALDGGERRIVRYRVVRLLDSPDELRASDIGQLDQGDEVQLIERSGSYWLVLCPDGRQGWLHRMTLGEVVSDGPVTHGTAVDEDVLAAYLAARSRA